MTTTAPMNKRSLWRRAAALFCLLLLAAALPLPVRALEDPAIQATAAILLDPATGMVLYDKAADEKRYPASTTKIMTALVVLEHANLDDMVTATKEDIENVEPGSSNADLKIGETVSVHDLLYCLMLPSANEAANMLARHVGGSNEGFVQMMNDKARQLGCTGTHFANPNGLHNENHYTTAHDLARIATAAMENETFAEIVNTAQKTIKATNMHPERKIFTTNLMILRKSDPSYYRYCKGIKTGHTEAAGYCLVSTATKNDATLISVVLGCTRSGQGSATALSFPETRRLFEWGFGNFKSKTLVEQSESVTEIPIRLSTDADHVVLQTAQELSAVVPIDINMDEVERTLDLPEDLTAPVAAGDVIGSMRVSYNGVDYGTVDLVALSDVHLSQVLYFADKLENFFHGQFFKICVLVLVGVFFLILLVRAATVRRRKRRKQRAIRDRYRHF